jgi:hypothetical protein
MASGQLFLILRTDPRPLPRAHLIAEEVAAARLALAGEQLAELVGIASR